MPKNFFSSNKAKNKKTICIDTKESSYIEMKKKMNIRFYPITFYNSEVVFI